MVDGSQLCGTERVSQTQECMCECILTINHACMYHAMPAGMHTHLVGIEMMETSIAK